MSRRFALVTVVLVATAAFLVGLIVAGSLTPAPADSLTTRPTRAASATRMASLSPALVNFADVAEHINPAVVTKLSDRGSAQTVGVVTDVGLFLKQLALQLGTPASPS